MKNNPKQIIANEPHMALLIVNALYKLLSTTVILIENSILALWDCSMASQIKNKPIKKNTKVKTNH